MKPSSSLAVSLINQLNIPAPEQDALVKFARGGPPPALPLHALPNNNLPAQITSFVGREKELADVKKLLRNALLLTLIGSGGTGKTRLSIQSASESLTQYPDGVWLVELAPILDPLLVPRTTAISIGLRDEPQRPVIDMLCDYLRDKKLLILLDNCEHLVDACAQMAERLLRAGTNTRVLATSREALGIAGEVTYRVPSLGLPDLGRLPSVETLSQYEAVKLFIDRATSVVSTFTVTNDNAPALAQICYRLDGIPLAIELAAAKIRVLSVDQIAKRLDDRFRLLTGGSRTALERHQTLRAALDWSYNLLPPAEQVLFRRLSVFVGGWTLEAAESVCGDPSTALRTASGQVGSEDVLHLLEGLINKSLVIAEESQRESRYRMLETMRQYANEKLVESGENDALRDRHLQYFLRLAEELEPRLYNAEGAKWLDVLDTELDNLRLALGLSIDSGKAQAALRFVAALNRLWYSHCYHTEGFEWTRKALAIDDGSSRLLRAKAVATAGGLQRDSSKAKLYLAESAALYREVGELAEMGNVLIWLSGFEEDDAKRRTLAEEGLETCRRVGYKRGIQNGLNHLGAYAQEAGDYSKALELYEEALALNRKMQRENGIACVLTNLGELAYAQGDNVKARSLYREALEIFQKLKDRRQAADVVSGIANILASEGQRTTAAALQGFVMVVYDELGFELEGIELTQRNETVEALRSSMGKQVYQKVFEEGKALSLEQAVALAMEE